MKAVYLLHFDRPYEHAQHYLGSTDNLDYRLERHRKGNGGRLIQVITAAGISFQLARVWKNEGRALEKRLKGSHARLLCPICTPGTKRGRATPFVRRKRRRVRFTQKELSAMRHGYKDARAGRPCLGDANGAYKRGYRKGISAGPRQRKVKRAGAAASRIGL